MSWDLDSLPLDHLLVVYAVTDHIAKANYVIDWEAKVADRENRHSDNEAIRLSQSP